MFSEDVKPGSKIRYGVETSRRHRGRAVVLSRNGTIKSVDDEKVITTKGIELKHEKKVGSRSNIEQHSDWHVIKEDIHHRIRAVVSKNDKGFNGTPSTKKKLTMLVKSETSNSSIEKVNDRMRKTGYKIHSIKHDGKIVESAILNGDPIIEMSKEKVLNHMKSFLNESAFGDAFSKARSAGKDVFDFNGKSFNTRQKGETEAQWKSNLKPAPKPAERSPVQGASGPSGRGRPASSQKPVQGASGPANRGRPTPNSAGPQKPVQGASGPANRGRPASSQKPASGASGPANRGKPAGSRGAALAKIDINKRVSSSIRGDDGAASAAQTLADRARRGAAIKKVDVVGNMNTAGTKKTPALQSAISAYAKSPAAIARATAAQSGK